MLKVSSPALMTFLVRVDIFHIPRVENKQLGKGKCLLPIVIFPSFLLHKLSLGLISSHFPFFCALTYYNYFLLHKTTLFSLSHPYFSFSFHLKHSMKGTISLPHHIQVKRKIFEGSMWTGCHGNPWLVWVPTSA